MHGSNLSDFIDYLELFNELGQEHKTETSDANAINLMTVHASKGLEFDTVILVNLAHQRFPLTRGGVEPLIPDELDPQVNDLFNEGLGEKELEAAIKERMQEFKLKEERKLCYVAMTRAKKSLTLTRAKEYGGSEREPSIFISDLGLTDYGDYDTITYLKDEETSGDWSPDTELDREKKIIINQLIKSLEENDINTSINHLLTYKGLIGQETNQKELTSNWESINPTDRLKRLQDKIKSGIINSLPFDATNFKLSASALKSYHKCPRQFELTSIYRMPSYWDEDSSGATNRGSFVHEVLEQGVKIKVKTIKELFDIKDSLLKQPKWRGVNTDGVDNMLKVFWERNKGRIESNLFTEEKFDFLFKDFRFNGTIDRIDKVDDGVEVIDYKTGKSDVTPDEAFIQLGLYTIAIITSAQFKGLKPTRLTLDMLEHEKPKEYKIEGDEIKLLSGRGKSTTMKEVEEMILNLAKNIMHDYQHGFKKNNKECERCPYKFYCE